MLDRYKIILLKIDLLVTLNNTNKHYNPFTVKGGFRLNTEHITDDKALTFEA